LRPEGRRHEIVEMLVEHGSATLEALAEHFGVSKMTIHRDLDALEAEGRLRKLRGGATLESSGQFESDFRYRARMAGEEKARIAQHAAGFVEPGMSVMVDDGSTSQALAPHLAAIRPLTVITNNLGLISDLSGKPGIELIALGGNYASKFNGFFGVLTETALRDLRADMALISSSAVSERSAFHQDQEVLGVKRAMIASAAQRYLMVDHQKFGRTALHLLADLEDFDGVVTSDALERTRAETLRQDGIRLHFAERD